MTAIRLPVRIVVLVLVVPVRMGWDALVVGGRFLRDTVLRPAGRGLARLGRAVFVWPWVALWQHVAVPVGRALLWLGRVLVVVPLVWVYRWVLTPVGHAFVWVVRRTGETLAWLHARVLTPVGHALVWVVRTVGEVLAWIHARVLTPVGHALVRVARAIGLVLAVVGAGALAGVLWLGRWLLVVPAVWLYTWVLAPAGRGIAWCAKGLWWVLERIAVGAGTALHWTGRVLLVLPALALWRWVLVPLGHVLTTVGREIADALGHAWRIAGRISLVVGRFLRTLFRWIFVQPLRWMYRTVLTPAGHFVRDAVLRPATRAARRAGRIGREVFSAARDIARQTRADLRKAIFGEPRPPARREPVPAGTRTLDKGTGREASPSTRDDRRSAPRARTVRRTRGEVPLGKRQPEGPPPAPVVQRIRLRYTKRGRLRFTSHRDFQRAFERALRRAEVPMAYSAGFTPHPRVSYANAAPTGTGSEAEYLEIALTAPRDPERLRVLLDESLPAGLDIVEAVEARTPAFADRLTASVWELRLDGVDPAEAARAVAAFNGAETVEVQRLTKNGMRTFDARSAVVKLESVPTHGSVADGPTDRPCAILRLVVRHVTPAVRPDDVLSGLRAVADLAPPVPAAVTRLAQGLFDEETGTVTDPLAPDREADGAAPADSVGAAAPAAAKAQA